MSAGCAVSVCCAAVSGWGGSDRLQSMTVVSAEAVASVRPSGLNLAEATARVWPVRVRVCWKFGASPALSCASGSVPISPARLSAPGCSVALAKEVGCCYRGARLGVNERRGQQRAFARSRSERAKPKSILCLCVRCKARICTLACIGASPEVHGAARSVEEANRLRRYWPVSVSCCRSRLCLQFPPVLPCAQGSVAECSQPTLSAQVRPCTRNEGGSSWLVPDPVSKRVASSQPQARSPSCSFAPAKGAL